MKSKLFSWIALGLLFLSACRTPSPPAAPAVSEVPTAVTPLDLGLVAQVNESLQYAIIRCAVLPSDGEEVTICRNDKEVARLKVTGPRRPPYVSADVLSGSPRQGDRVRQVVTISTK
jgi:hypothetical protein